MALDENNESYNSDMRLPIYLKNNMVRWTCGFITGKTCHNTILLRRWTCCKQCILGTMDDVKELPGCFDKTGSRI